MFRGAVDGEPFLDGRTMAIVKGDNGIDLVVYPIGGGMVNWVIQLPDAEPGPLTGDAGGTDPPTQARSLRDRALAAGLAGRRRTGQPHRSGARVPDGRQGPVAALGHGRVTLLGDAAHPMYPVGANGGSQAILDARVSPTSSPTTSTADSVATRTSVAGRPPTSSPPTGRCTATGASRNPDELASVTAELPQHDTKADRRQA